MENLLKARKAKIYVMIEFGRDKFKFAFCFSLAVLLTATASFGIDGEKARLFAGQDLHLTGKEVISYQLSTGEHTLVFEKGLSLSIGANEFSSDRGVVWLESVIIEIRGRAHIDYKTRIYLSGNVKVSKTKASKTTGIRRTIVDEGEASVLQFNVSGEVFVTSEKRAVADPRQTGLYKKALSAFVPAGTEFVIEAEAMVPELVAVAEKVIAEKPKEKKPVVKKAPAEKEAVDKPRKPAKKTVPSRPVVQKQTKVTDQDEKPKFRLLDWFKKKPAQPAGKVKAEPAPKLAEKKPKFAYPVNISPAGEEKLKIESARAVDGTSIATITQRFYIWQQQDEGGDLLELQADSAVVFYSGSGSQSQEDSEGGLTSGAIRAIYVSGDVIMTEGRRTTRADEMYYDFRTKRGLVVNAIMRSYDANRNIPIYIRAARIRRVAENRFAAENIVLTTSEFHKPQISTRASRIIVTDLASVNEEAELADNDSTYDAQMHDVKVKVGEATVLYWPFLRSNLEQPDIPIKTARVSYDSDFGASVETRWYLSRMLGLREPEGVDSTLALDYFGKRGTGVGVTIDYTKENCFGTIKSYVIKDKGKDTLGRHASRQDVNPRNEMRGRFSWLHRQFLPDRWQLTASIGYASDAYFLEGFYRGEYNVGREETYFHLKRIEDNRGLSLLGKGRINNFDDTLEELPTLEYHIVGQSFYNDRFTLYSDTQISRLRQTVGQGHTFRVSDERYAFAMHRTEIDMPVRMDPFKVVGYVAGTFGYDDRSGFTRTLVDGSNTGKFSEDQVWIGETGVRLTHRSFWKVYPKAMSRLWDINQLRHVITPSLVGAVYTENHSAVKQRDTLNLSFAQRLQTKRGPAGDQRTVDWMRLDTDFVWVKDSANASDAGPGPDQFIWAKPIVPLRVFSYPDIFSGDLVNNFHRFELFGPRRNYFGADYIWRISDSSVLLSDLNFDMQSCVVQQFNIGISRLVWPNLSYYIGSRYLRRIKILDEEGSNTVTFAATYILDPRYTVVFSQQYDFDYGGVLQNNVTLIRRYHRMAMSFSYSADHSLKSQAIVFSIWPEGIRELALGPRRHVELGGGAGF